MKTFTLLITLVFTLQLSAQDPILQKDNEILEAKAMKIAKTYNEQLALDGEQFLLFEKKVEEYLIREEEIHKKFEAKERLHMLYKLRRAETFEMQNILTKPQLDLYKRIKPQIQPLAKVDVKEKGK